MANTRTLELKSCLHAGSGSSTASRTQQRRVHLSADVLTALKLATGDFVVVRKRISPTEGLEKINLGDGARRDFILGLAWPSFSLDAQGCAHFSQELFDEMPGLQPGEPIEISPMIGSGLIGAEIQTITLLPPGIESAADANDKLDRLTVQAELKCMRTHQRVNFSHNGRQQTFTITEMTFAEGRKDAEIGLFTAQSILSIAKSAPKTQKRTLSRAPAKDAYLAVGGLTQQIAQIRELVELPLSQPDLYKHFGLVQPRGLLLHGPAGTGKTLLASTIATSLGLPFFEISGASLASPYHGETEGKLREIFQQAQAAAPSIIILDEVDAMAPKREDAGDVDKRVVAELLVLMDGLNNKSADTEIQHVMVIACTNRPNAIDAALRRPGRFDREIEIGVPDVDSRLSILNVHLKDSPSNLSDSQKQSLADRTHGYVGADIASLVHTAGMNALRRCLYQKTLDQAKVVNIDDFDAALLVTRPSAMREVFLELPKVKWTDIGGQEQVIQKLRECVEWPITRRHVFKRLGVRPPTGILLYGPPGCSKTMLARAMATEAGLNFIAVKGPEVFNKYVGESERQIRILFQKARAAAPSILFLDEIDAIATTRSGGDSSGSDRILISLLTELDGIEPLQGVVLLAATNRPWSIDTALLRPGRLDRLLYVGLPDAASREAILRLQTSKMAVQIDLDIPSLTESTNGCTGAEIAAICQDAALLAMNEDADASVVAQSHFDFAARGMRRRVTAASIREFELWREQSSS